MTNPYADIINLPYHKSHKHPHMPNISRAAQFAPFAALTGHSEAVDEVARLTDRKVLLDDQVKADLNDRLYMIQAYADQNPEVSIVYFQKDPLKEGGSYVTISGPVKKIDDQKGVLVMADDREILISDMIEIDCALFTKEAF